MFHLWELHTYIHIQQEAPSFALQNTQKIGNFFIYIDALIP